MKSLVILQSYTGLGQNCAYLLIVGLLALALSLQPIIQCPAFAKASENAADRFLVEAARKASLNGVKEALQKGANLNTLVVLDGYEELSPLMAACQSNELDVVKFFLRNKVEINLRNSHGDTALIIAASKGDLEVVKLLRRHAADINIRDNAGKNAALRAAEVGNFAVVDFLIRDIPSPLGLESALLIGGASQGKFQVVREAILKGADPNWKTEKGITALETAASFCRADIVRFLLVAGAKVDPEDADVHSGLYLASEIGCTETMRILLNAGRILKGKTLSLAGRH